MKVKDLLEGMQYKLVQGNEEQDVSGLSWDSRKVSRDSLFICVRGRNVDRHDYAKQAIEEGAAALVVEKDVPGIPADVSVFQVKNSRQAMAAAAARYYRYPAEQMRLVGVTGTNGKTSVTCFIARILETAGRKPGIIGTIDNLAAGSRLKVEKINPTTPDSIELQATLREMADLGVTEVAMEVTSSALSQERVYGCRFEAGIFTNLTQDHLEEHGTMENYKKAKLKLFNMCRYGVVNRDDPVYPDIERESTCSLLTYGLEIPADITATDVSQTMEGMSFLLNLCGERIHVSTRMSGRFNLYNILAAAGACRILGLSAAQIAEGIEKLEGARGRFECIPNPGGFRVVVDYAHTPDGLENILTAARFLTTQKVVVVFGCGGDRDRTKRPLMGKIAAERADYCILTSDNPRTEDPDRIIEDIAAGLEGVSCRYVKIRDRRTAIRHGLTTAVPGDVVVIAGKGHETYQIFGSSVVHFDDAEVIREFFKEEAAGTLL